MADTVTSNLNLTKPEVGASQDTWGTKLNANFDIIDGAVAARLKTADLLSAIKDVDGAGSGIDADLLDGQSGAYYRDLANSTGTLPNARVAGAYSGITDLTASGQGSFKRLVTAGRVVSTTNAMIISNIGADNTIRLRPVGENDTTNELLLTASALTLGGNAVWHAGNDGPGSGMNADLLDNMQSADGPTANTIVSRDASGDIQARLLRTTFASASQTAYFVGMNNFTTDNYHRPMTPAQAAAALDAYLVPVGRSITAGTGLTGGGSLAANRSFAVDATVWRDGNQPSAAQIAALMNATPVGGVGTYGFFRCAVAFSPGTNVAGANLAWASRDNSGDAGVGGSPAGTWEACAGSTNDANHTGIFRRL